MKDLDKFYTHLASWSWSKQTSFYLMLSEESYRKLQNSKIKNQDEALSMLKDLQALCWKFMSHEKVTLLDIDIFLDPEGERYNEGDKFTNTKYNKGEKFSDPQLAHTFFITINLAGLIGNYIKKISLTEMSGGVCYIGNTTDDLLIGNALKAGVITPAILETFGIDPSLDLSRYIASK